LKIEADADGDHGPQVSNHYAAMPSMHFGYSLWVAVTVMQFFCVTLQPSVLHRVRRAHPS
jgi:hypothetical protein